MRQIASAHMGGQVLTSEGKTCSLRMSFTKSHYTIEKLEQKLEEREKKQTILEAA
jgi:hypothetical protein